MCKQHSLSSLKSRRNMIPKYEPICIEYLHLSLPELNRQCCADFEISTTLFVGTILVKIDVLNTCGVMICSHFRIVMRFHQM